MITIIIRKKFKTVFASVSQLDNELGFHPCILSAYHNAWHAVDIKLRFSNLGRIEFKCNLCKHLNEILQF